MYKLVAASIFLVGICPLTAPANAATLRQPAGKWVVDYGETGCSAARAYGTDEAPVTISFRPSPGGTVVRLVILRPGRGPDAEHFAVKTSVTPAKAGMTGLRFATTDGKKQLVWINFDRAALDALPAAGEIAIAGRGVMDERFALPGIAAVLKALDRCNADLRAHWNIGEAARTVIATPAKADKPLYRYVSNTDYPGQAIFEGASGATSFTMLVDEKGVVKDCLVEETSGIATLDAQTCAVLVARAKFSPALDAAGKPARSVVNGRIRWQMAG